MFEKIYVDYSTRSRIEVQGVREGLLFVDEVRTDSEFRRQLEARNTYLSKALTVLMLFRKLDSTSSSVDWSPLAAEGVVDYESTILRDGMLLPREQAEIAGSNDDAYRRMAVDIIEAKKNHVVRQFFAMAPKTYGDAARMSEMLDYDFFLRNHDVELKGAGNAYEHIIAKFDFIMDLFRLSDEAASRIYNSWTPYFTMKSNDMWATVFTDWVSRLVFSIQDVLALAATNEVPFSVLHGSGTKHDGQAISTVVEDVYYIARTGLRDEVIILPRPRCIREAIEFRNRPEMEDFREVLGEWCGALQDGNAALERRMRRDIRKANRALKNVNRWECYQRSPINFWLTSIGGHVPILSNVLTAVYTAGETLSRIGVRKNRWVGLIQSGI